MFSVLTIEGIKISNASSFKDAVNVGVNKIGKSFRIKEDNKKSEVIDDLDMFIRLQRLDHLLNKNPIRFAK